MKTFLALLMSLATAAATTASAQTWPAKPVKVLVGYGAGGITDVVIRVASEDLAKRLGQPFVVENRTGAGGLIAATAVKNAAPDGYTMFGGSGTPIVPLFLKDNFMDMPRELQPLSLIALGDHFLMVRSDLGVTSFKDLVEKARTTRLRHSSISIPQQLLMTVLAKRAKFEFDNIPYKTTDQTISSLLTGDGDFMLNSLAGSMPYVQNGKFRVLATLASERSPLLPNVPTATEMGYNLEARFNLGYWAPSGTPRDVVTKVGAAVAEWAKTPAAIEKMATFSLIPAASTPEGLVRAHTAEVKVFEEAAPMIGLKPQ